MPIPHLVSWSTGIWSFSRVKPLFQTLHYIFEMWIVTKFYWLCILLINCLFSFRRMIISPQIIILSIIFDSNHPSLCQYVLCLPSQPDGINHESKTYLQSQMLEYKSTFFPEVITQVGGCYLFWFIYVISVPNQNISPDTRLLSCPPWKEFRAFELLRSGLDRSKYLLVKEAKIIAMTCTHAALKRHDLVELGFKVDSSLST